MIFFSELLTIEIVFLFFSVVFNKIFLVGELRGLFLMKYRELAFFIQITKFFKHFMTCGRIMINNFESLLYSWVNEYMRLDVIKVIMEYEL